MRDIQGYHELSRTDVLDMVPPGGGRLLDVGGGVGAAGAALKARGCAKAAYLIDHVADRHVDGIDRAFAGDLEDLSLIDRVAAEVGPFDVVLLLDVLEHLRDPWAVAERACAALVPGGLAVISLPNVGHYTVLSPLIRRGRFELEDWGIKDRTHLRWFGRDDMVALTEGAGLVVESVTPRLWTRRERALNAGTMGLFERFLARQFILKARRPA